MNFEELIGVRKIEIELYNEVCLHLLDYYEFYFGSSYVLHLNHFEGEVAAIEKSVQFNKSGQANQYFFLDGHSTSAAICVTMRENEIRTMLCGEFNQIFHRITPDGIFEYLSLTRTSVPKGNRDLYKTMGGPLEVQQAFGFIAEELQAQGGKKPNSA